LGGNLEDGYGNVGMMVEMNFQSAFGAAQLAAECLDDDGMVVLTGAAGVAGDSTVSFAIGYGMTKAATHKLAETMAYEPDASGLPAGTRTLCMLPGTLDTYANQRAMPDADQSTWTHPLMVADSLLCWHAQLRGGSLPPKIEERLPEKFMYVNDDDLFVKFDL